MPVSFHFVIYIYKKVTDNEIFGPHALCMLLLKCHPWVTQPTNGLLIKSSNCQRSSPWREAWRQHLLWERDRWPYLSVPASTAASGGNWEEGWWGLPCTLCPGEGWLTGCGGGTAPAAVPLRLEWLLAKMGAETKRERQHETVPWRRPRFKHRGWQQAYFRDLFVFLWVPFRERSSPSWIHTAFASMAEQVPWLCVFTLPQEFQLGLLQAHLGL